MRAILAGRIFIILSAGVILFLLTANLSAQIPEWSHFKTRSTILSKLNDYIEYNAAGKTGLCDSLSHELKWLTGLYTEMYGVHDLSLKYRTYIKWNRKQAQSKLSIDRVYRWFITSRNNADSDSFTGLENLTEQYASINDSFGLAVLLKDKAQLFEMNNEVDSAICYYHQSLKMCQSLDYYSLAGNTEMLLGRIYNYRLGDYIKSELAYCDAIDHFRKVDERRLIPFVQLGRVYDLLQLYKTEAAIRLAGSLIPGLNKSKDISNLAQCHYFLAVAYNNIGMLDSALFYGARALDLRKVISNKLGRYLVDLGYSMTYMGQIYQACGNRRQALEMYRSADSVFQKAGASDGISNNLIAWGNYLVEIEDYTSARIRFDQVDRLSPSYEMILAPSYGLAVCDYYLGDSRSAIDRLKHCIWLIENTNRKLPVPELKTGILSDKIGYFNLLACIYVRRFNESGQAVYVDSALQCLEKSKSRALVDNLTKNDTREIDSAETRILRQISTIHNSDQIKLNPEDALEKIHVLEDSLLTFYMEESGRGEDNIARPEGIDISIEIVQKHILGDNTVLLQYLLSQFGNYLFVISRDEFEVVEIDTDYQTLQDKIGQYLEMINSYPADSESFDNYKQLSRELYSLLIPDSALSSIHKDLLLVVASGPLHYLPMESLMNARKEYLVEKYEVSYIPSLSVLDLISHREYSNDGTSGAVIFAYSPKPHMEESDLNNGSPLAGGKSRYWDKDQFPPLTSCSLEVKVLDDCFGRENVEVFDQGNGSEDNFAQFKLDSGSYLHISAHGIIDERNPERSALVLAADDQSLNDGFLQPREIMKRNLPAPLVFLSSCRSGTGKAFPGEGVISLARPFLIAGCQSAIVTYWNISDVTSAQFVRIFYTGIKMQSRNATALALAKRDFIHSKREKLRHPYFWAPFVMIGR